MAAVAVGAYRTAAAPVADVPAVAPVLVPGDGDGAAVVLDEPPPHEDPRGPRWPWLALLLALLLIGGGVAAYLLTRPAKTPVPRVVGEQLSVANAQLQNAGFAVSTINVPDNHAAGFVLRQDPQPGIKAKDGSTVTLTVSSGPGNATVPPVLGMPLKQAKQAIRQARLRVGQVSKQSSTTVAKNNVISTDPASGATPQVGSRVNIVVSSGPPLVPVPDVTGQSEASAKSTLENRGFSVGSTTSQVSSTVQAGNVISQSPTGGSQLAQGSSVNLVIAKAPPPPPPNPTVPGVTGQHSDAAAAQLRAAGFNVSEQSQPVKKKKQNGVVISQSPGANSTAKKGSTVTIVIGQYTPPSSSSSTSTTPTTGNVSTTTTT
jgi:serine/threonine-protein kinase